jgi:serralysin
VICQSFRPWAEDCSYAPLPDYSAPQPDLFAPTSVFTNDQIAAQLTDGFWAPYGGTRSFDVAPGGVLRVDITGLTANGQAMARQALDAWTVVTGIAFLEVDSTAPANTIWVETSDAAGNISTAYYMSVGDDFRGTLSSGADRDVVALALTAGQTVVIEHNADASAGNPSADPYLWLLGSAGQVLAQNDDAVGRDSAITFQAPTTGTYYVQAGSFNDQSPGDYRISVRETAVSVDIVFDDAAAGAFASSSVQGNLIQSSFVNISPTWAGGANRTDGYYFQTYLHEIGHALGLGHAGDYNGNATYATDALYYNDSWQATVMSYFHQTQNTWLDASFAYAITPMMADIIAIQNLYGMPQANTGNTFYGPGGTTGTYLDAALGLSNPVTFTVFDTAGTDTFDFSSYSAHQRLDLRQETFSDLAGLTGNVGISRGTVIENALTGGGNDILIGNAADNALSSGAGNDSVDAGAGNDVIRGGAGRDTLSGGDGFDFLEGGTGDNSLSGGTGGDLLIGGDLTLDILLMIYPDWSPPADAQQRLDEGDLMSLWQDIVDDLAFA